MSGDFIVIPFWCTHVLQAACVLNSISCWHSFELVYLSIVLCSLIGRLICRNYARYFGGDLTIMSMEGYGTDSFIYMPRLGDKASVVLQ